MSSLDQISDLSPNVLELLYIGFVKSFEDFFDFWLQVIVVDEGFVALVVTKYPSGTEMPLGTSS